MSKRTRSIRVSESMLPMRANAVSIAAIAAVRLEGAAGPNAVVRMQKAPAESARESSNRM